LDSIPRFSFSVAKILGQIENAAKSVSIEILARPKAKDATNDALPKFLAAYASSQKVGLLLKDTASGKLVSEWQAALEGAASKPEVIDMTPAISSLLAVKDEDELVSIF
jgi:nucleosome binding factor SPN SPT16 subunit